MHLTCPCTAVRLSLLGYGSKLHHDSIDSGNVATPFQSIVAMKTSGNLAMLPSLPASREQLLNQQSHVVRPIHSREANAINPNSLEHESGAFFHVLSHIQRRPAMPLRPIAPHLPIRIHQPHLPSSRRRLQTSCIRWRPSQRGTGTGIVINRNRNTKNNTYH